MVALRRPRTRARSRDGRLRGRKLESAAFAYNTVHTYALPVALAAAGVLAGADGLVAVSLIWIAHIGADRALGYGLKYPTDFKDTHLQRV